MQRASIRARYGTSTTLPRELLFEAIVGGGDVAQFEDMCGFDVS
jgi:hypothetical protein